MTIVTVDSKKRVTVRDAVVGARYIVKPEGDRFTLEPAPKPQPSRRRSRRDLCELLDGLAEKGFAFKPLKSRKAPPCRF